MSNDLDLDDLDQAALDSLGVEITAVRLVSTLSIAARRVQVSVTDDAGFAWAWAELERATDFLAAWMTTRIVLPTDPLRQLDRLWRCQSKAMAAVTKATAAPRPGPLDLARLVDEIDEAAADVADALDRIGQHLPVLIC